MTQRECLIFVGEGCHDCECCQHWQREYRGAATGRCLDPDIGGCITPERGGGCRNHFAARKDAP